MNTEVLVSSRIHRSRVVFQDAVSGMYEISSVYEINKIGSMRSSGFIDNIVGHKYVVSYAFFTLVT